MFHGVVFPKPQGRDIGAPGGHYRMPSHPVSGRGQGLQLPQTDDGLQSFGQLRLSFAVQSRGARPFSCPHNEPSLDTERSLDLAISTWYDRITVHSHLLIARVWWTKPTQRQWQNGRSSDMSRDQRPALSLGFQGASGPVVVDAHWVFDIRRSVVGTGIPEGPLKPKPVHTRRRTQKRQFRPR